MFDHWKYFKEFCHYEKLTGGPDPHMRTLVEICKNLSDEEKFWRACLYVGVYNVPSAEAIWRNWSHKQYGEHIVVWLDEHWRGIRLRRERRTAKSPIKLAEYLSGFRSTIENAEKLKNADFEEVWRFAMSLPRVGRYAATKLVEVWHQMGLVNATMPDIRPKGGWSPRAALNLLYPEHQHDEYANDEVDHANELAADVADQMCDLNLEYFEIEVLLCEYKESYSTRRQYPGRSLDSEIGYETKIREYWGHLYHDPVTVAETDHMKTRKKLFPHWALGEIQGWWSTRNELGRVLTEHGYTWSDSLYDYKATTNLGDPVLRGTDPAENIGIM